MSPLVITFLLLFLNPSPLKDKALVEVHSKASSIIDDFLPKKFKNFGSICFKVITRKIKEIRKASKQFSTENN
jgi:hypothetical protein